MKHRAILILLGCSLALSLSACRTAPEPVDEPPVEGVDEADEAADGLVSTSDLFQLLPKRTAAVMAIRAAELDGVAALLPMAEMGLGPLWGPEPLSPMLRDALVYGADHGVDRDRPVLVALGAGGSDEFYATIRAAAPLPGQDALPDHFHVRFLIPATEMDGLKEWILSRCEERGGGECREVTSVGRAATGGKGYVTVDIGMEQGDYGFEIAPSMDRGRLSLGAAGSPRSAAWQRLVDGDDGLAVYLPLQNLAEPLLFLSALQAEAWLGLMELRGEAAPIEAEDAVVPAISAALTGQLLFDMIEVAEIADATLGLSATDEALRIDGVASLTEYGQALATAMNQGAALAPSTVDPAVEVEWALDLRGAVNAARYPGPIAAAIDGAGADADHQRAILAEFFDAARELHPITMLAFTLRSPVTAFTLFQELTTGETTPSEFSRIKGFRASLGLPVSEGGEPSTAMALSLHGDEEDSSYEDFAGAALLPFAAGARSRTVAQDGGLQVQTTTSREPGDAFEDDDAELVAGVRGFGELSLVRQLHQVLGLPQQPGISFSDPGSLAETALPMTRFLPAYLQWARFSLGFGDAQVVHRLQIGGDEIHELPLVADAAVLPDRAGPACATQVAIWAWMVESTMGAAEDRVAHFQAAGEDLAILADECDDEAVAATLRESAEKWQAVGR